MKIVSLLISAFLGCSGLLILFRALRDSIKIYLGEVSSRIYSLKNAFLTGLSSSLLFLTLVFVGSITDNDFNWTIQGILGSLAISTLFGLIVFIGTYISFTIVGKYRETMYKKIVDKIHQDKLK